MRGILKRKFTEVDKDSCYSSSSSSTSSEWEYDSSSTENQDFTPQSPSSPATFPNWSKLKRSKITGVRSSVHFDEVTVFSFPRCQGFTSVPSRGGATLGMMQTHSALRRYTVAEHVLERRHRRREKLKERLRVERFEAFKHKLISSGSIDQQEADRLTVDQVREEDADVHVSDKDLEDRRFLQPFPSWQRQALLQAAGVKQIDREEKRQLHALRRSREACGCDCQGFCEPETCACSLAGIKCQVDRFNFPCGCTKDNCGNTEGRIEFDSRRVRTHHIHTLMRLELERRLQHGTLSQDVQADLPEELRQYENPREASTDLLAADKLCPFGYALEEDSFPLTVPAAPSFHVIPERLAVEENSCSSDMTESSCSSSDSGGSIGGSLPEADEGLSCSLRLCDSESSFHSSCSHLKHSGETLAQLTSSSSSLDSNGPHTNNTFTDNINRTAVSDYLDENANQAMDLFIDDSLEDFPNTPSPTMDFSFGRYMDLSLSSESDLEFFDSDYPSRPLHSSFKPYRHMNSFRPIQMLSFVNLPSYESSTHLLESLIGLTEPKTE